MNIELYIHIPFCMKKCDYCDFLSGVYDSNIQHRYTLALCKELSFMGAQCKNDTVSTVYIGGGTPSWLELNDIALIMKTVDANFNISDDSEITIEANPGTLGVEKVKTYKHLGINRISLGLQSANDDELKLLGRIHTYERFLYTYDAVKRGGFNDVNVDIMTGLPYQTMEKLNHTLNCVTALRPEHISAYSLIVEPGTPFYDRYHADAMKQQSGIQPSALPTDEESYNLYRRAIDFLEKKRYIRYEISNYCRDELYPCIHNIGYWTRVPYIGVGIGAASLYAEHRMSNTKDIYQYMDTADRMDKVAFTYEPLTDSNPLTSPFWETDIPLSRSDAMSEFMYLGLRMMEGITRDSFKEAFNADIEAIYGPVLQSLKAQSLIIMDGGVIKLTDLGIDVSNQVLANFLL